MAKRSKKGASLFDDDGGAGVDTQPPGGGECRLLDAGQVVPMAAPVEVVAELLGELPSDRVLVVGDGDVDGA